MLRNKPMLILVLLASGTFVESPVRSAEGEVCGGIAGIPCDPGEFCKLPQGGCCCDFQGICTPIPAECITLFDPVCGCDGVTYGNECEADAAGVSIAHYGRCEDAQTRRVCCLPGPPEPNWSTCLVTTQEDCEGRGGTYLSDQFTCRNSSAVCNSSL